jgi:exosortase/archaeosortase
MLSKGLNASFIKSLNAFGKALPVIFGMLLLTSLLIKLMPVDTVSNWFGRNGLLDGFIGATAGSVAAGHPLASYILGGELIAGGVSLFAVTAFIVTWVTVGIVQLPAEMMMLGRRFAVYRNLTSFILAILVSLLTVYTVNALKGNA